MVCDEWICFKMEKNTAVNLDDKIIISENEVPPKDRNKSIKSITCVFIKKHIYSYSTGD